MHVINLFGISFNVDPVAFTIPGLNWSIYWYGICIAVGVMLALWYGMKNGNRLGMNPDHIFNTFLVTLPCCVLGARAYYLIFDGGLGALAHFFDFSGHKGFAGLAIYGGVIMAVICILIFWRIYKFNVLAALDITAIGLLIGQGVGRWGNFFNQEAYGTFTGSNFFGMTGDIIAFEMGSNDLVHPCFLYESVWCLLGVLLLHYFSKRRRFKGQLALMYGMWYGLERCIVEQLRTDSLMLYNIRVSSLLSGIICVGSAITFAVLMKKHAKAEPAYTPQFANEESAEKVPPAEPTKETDSTENSAEK